MTMRYHWVHLESGKRGVMEFEEGTTITGALMLLNKWNRTAMILSETPTYHYWME